MIGSAGKQHAHALDHVEAAHAGQAEVEQHEVERAVRDARERVLAREHGRDGVVLRLERDAQRPQHGRLVVDDQDPWALHVVRRELDDERGAAAGRRLDRMWPPWASTKPRLMARPRPVPLARSWPGRRR